MKIFGLILLLTTLTFGVKAQNLIVDFEINGEEVFGTETVKPGYFERISMKMLFKDQELEITKVDVRILNKDLKKKLSQEFTLFPENFISAKVEQEEVKIEAGDQVLMKVFFLGETSDPIPDPVELDRAYIFKIEE